MNILITGAAGLLGQNLVALLSEEHIVYALIRDGEELICKNENIKIIRSDLYSFNSDILPTDINVIYYLAQSRRFREFPGGVFDMFEINIYSPLKCIEWAVKNGVKKFFYASSGGVYRNPTRPVKEFFDIVVNEKNGFYIDSKLCGEILLKNFSSYFETFTILRPFFMFGPGQNRSMLIPRLIMNIKNGNEIIINNKEGIKINPIYIEDAAKAFGKLIDLEGEYIFNIAGNEIVNIKELANLISNIADCKPVFKYVDKKQFDLVADIELMKKMLHIPEISLMDGLQKTYKSLLEDL